MISLLQSLRFIFAIMIFLHHYPVDGTGWLVVLVESRSSWQLEMVVCFLLILFSNYVVYHYYEIPVSKSLKRKIVCVK